MMEAYEDYMQTYYACSRKFDGDKAGQAECYAEAAAQLAADQAECRDAFGRGSVIR